jgi:hypothetical protein
MISASELVATKFPPLRWHVDGLIPEGVSILAGPPKTGKSFLLLTAATRIAAGMDFLGRHTSQTGVLYFALEDSPRRSSARLSQVLGTGRAPADLFVENTSARIGEAAGFFEALESSMSQQNDIGLVIVDTYQYIRKTQTRGTKDDAYERDYSDIVAFREFGLRHGVSFILAHHTRKLSTHGEDFSIFDRIHGSIALAGAPDTTMVLTPDGDDTTHLTLHARGKDVAFQSLALAQNIDLQNYSLELIGSAADAQRERARQIYMEHPLRTTILHKVYYSGADVSDSCNILQGQNRILRAEKIYVARPSDLRQDAGEITHQCVGTSTKNCGEILRREVLPWLFLDDIGFIEPVARTTHHGRGGMFYQFFRRGEEAN